LRVTLIPASLVRYIAAPFASLFQPVAAMPAMVLIACAAAYWITMQHVAPPPLSGGELLAGYAVFVISCLAHELGHAGACLRFGVRPGPIGIALYLVFPVLYSDVTRIWRLRRWHRVAVDVGGSYVQCLCGAFYAVVYVQIHAPALLLAVALIIAATLLNMNPLFRFDGYWVISDALGVTGLFTHVGRLVPWLALRLAGREDVAALPWPDHIVAAIAIYGVVALMGWAWFVTRLIAYVCEQGRWLLTVVPAMGRGEWMSLALFGQLGSAAIGAIALAFFLIRLLCALRSRCACSPRR
jgi:putative peptide zinc metalloprotease protein